VHQPRRILAQGTPVEGLATVSAWLLAASLTVVIEDPATPLMTQAYC
jgi:hypothetical protein